MRDKFIGKSNDFFEDENFHEKQNEGTNKHLEDVCPLPEVEGWVVSTLSDSIKELSVKKLKSILDRLQKTNNGSIYMRDENVKGKR